MSLRDQHFLTALNTNYRRNSNLLYLRSETLSISGERPIRRKRRAKSIIVSRLRNLSALDNELPISCTRVSRSSGSSLIKDSMDNKENKGTSDGSDEETRPVVRSISSPLRLIWDKEKVRSPMSPLTCEYFTLMPVVKHPSTCLKTESFKLNEIGRSYWTQNKPDQSTKQRVHAVSYNSQLENSVTSQTDHIPECSISSDEDDTLPPYFKILPQMFFRFAGISPYSDSIIRQSRQDFTQFLKCLGLLSFVESFLHWFPKPKLVKVGKGYITFDMFCDVFSCKFAKTILETRWEYEALCSAILTMNYLDKQNTNRITFDQFSCLCRSLYGDYDKSKISNVFNKYDTNGVGLLTIVDIFNFCCDEEGIEV